MSTSEFPRIFIHGASGRMGRALMALAPEFTDAHLVAVSPEHAASEQGGIVGIPRDHLHQAPPFDVLIDFSAATALPAVLELCVRRNAALVSGTTGYSVSDWSAMDAAAAHIAVLHANNFSLGIAAMELLVEQAARLLRDWDCEILDLHHRHKRDAPSGTALSLLRAANSGRAQSETWRDRIAEATAGSARESTSIGISSLRGGSVVGEHRVGFYGEGERVELLHQAEDRSIFARGAWHAAQRIAGRAPGRYALRDLFAP